MSYLLVLSPQHVFARSRYWFPRRVNCRWFEPPPNVDVRSLEASPVGVSTRYPPSLCDYPPHPLAQPQQELLSYLVRHRVVPEPAPSGHPPPVLFPFPCSCRGPRRCPPGSIPMVGFTPYCRSNTSPSFPSIALFLVCWCAAPFRSRPGRSASLIPSLPPPAGAPRPCFFSSQADCSSPFAFFGGLLPAPSRCLSATIAAMPFPTVSTTSVANLSRNSCRLGCPSRNVYPFPK